MVEASPAAMSVCVRATEPPDEIAVVEIETKQGYGKHGHSNLVGGCICRLWRAWKGEGGDISDGGREPQTGI